MNNAHVNETATLDALSEESVREQAAHKAEGAIPTLNVGTKVAVIPPMPPMDRAIGSMLGTLQVSPGVIVGILPAVDGDGPYVRYEIALDHLTTEEFTGVAFWFSTEDCAVGTGEDNEGAEIPALQAAAPWSGTKPAEDTEHFNPADIEHDVQAVLSWYREDTK